MESGTESAQNPHSAKSSIVEGRFPFPNSNTASTLRMPHESAVPGTQTASRRLYNEVQGPAGRLRLSSAQILSLLFALLRG